MKRDNPCILVVDDEKQNIHLLTCYFKRTNYEVIISYTGENALDKMQKTLPDLVLLDIQMPGMDGIEVLRMAKSNAAIKNIPIIMFSACDTKENIAISFELGATAFISKPINFQLIMKEINKVFGLGIN